MVATFRPQETTMNSMTQTEQKLYESFVAAGFEHKQANAIAHSFTQYMLDYLTEEGAAQLIVKTNVDRSVAREIVTEFSRARDRALNRRAAVAG